MFERIKKLFSKKEEESVITPSESIDYLFDTLVDGHNTEISIGEDLLDHTSCIEDVVDMLRITIKSECGFIIPQINVVYNCSLQENEFEMYIKKEKVAGGFLIPNETGIREELYDELKTVLYDNLSSLFTNDIAERYIDTAQRKNGWLIWNITRILSVVDIRIILSEIINKGKSINNIGYVFEKIGENLFTGQPVDCYFKDIDPHKIANNIIKIL